MTEFDFIRRYLARQQYDAQVVLGIGDDAAIVRPQAGFDLCFSSDMLLAGRHFFADVAPADLAHKVLAVNISDMAAMGAQPRWALLSAALPVLDEAWLTAFCDSLFALAEQFGVTLIGGDTTKGDYVFNVTIAGELPQGQALRRDAAKPGDDIWVSGNLGAAAAALHHLQGTCELPEAVYAACEPALLRPMPRVALGQALLPLAHAAQDVSDGLTQDVGHILRASDVGAVIFADKLPALPQLREALPQERLYECMLGGGDDYELVFTAPAASRDAVAAAGRASGTAVSRIGQINDSGSLRIEAADGSEIKPASLGFDHFG